MTEAGEPNPDWRAHWEEEAYMQRHYPVDLTVSHQFVCSPNKPRPADPLTLEIADMLWHIKCNYDRESSGPGSRFEGRLLEDVQAEAVLRRIQEFEARP